MLYFTTFTDYGFGLSATRSVALHRTDWRVLRQLHTDVTLAKLILPGAAVVSSLILTVLLFTRQ